MVDILTYLVEKQDTHGGKMKLTRRQLRRLISEHMISPTFFAFKERNELVQRIFDDPEVDSKIKDLLKHEDEAFQNMGLELMRTLNPEYEQDIDELLGVTSTKEYQDKFSDARDNFFFKQIEGLVNKYKSSLNDLEVENISSDTEVSSSTSIHKPSGRKYKKAIGKRLHGAAIYTSDEDLIKMIASELDAAKGLDGERLYHGVGGQGQPLLPYVNDYYVTAFDSNLRYKREMHKKGKYELKVFPAVSDTRRFPLL